MLRILARDGSTQFGAALNEWAWPASREHLALLDLYDRFAGANYKNPRTHPRPWDKPNRLGATSLPPEEAKARLRRAAGRAA